MRATDDLTYGEAELLLAITFDMPTDDAREAVDLLRERDLPARVALAAARGARSMGCSVETALAHVVDVATKFATRA